MAKYKLTKEETNNLKGREKALEYLEDIIHRDINMYLYADVMPRLNLKDVPVELSADREWLEVTESKSVNEKV